MLDSSVDFIPPYISHGLRVSRKWKRDSIQVLKESKATLEAFIQRNYTFQLVFPGTWL